MKVLVPLLAVLMAEALHRLVSVPVTGILCSTQVRVLPDPQEGAGLWVLWQCTAAGLLEALFLSLVRPMRLRLMLKVLLKLGGCFRRTRIRPHDEGPYFLKQSLHGGVAAALRLRHRDNR